MVCTLGFGMYSTKLPKLPSSINQITLIHSLFLFALRSLRFFGKTFRVRNFLKIHLYLLLLLVWLFVFVAYGSICSSLTLSILLRKTTTTTTKQYIENKKWILSLSFYSERAISVSVFCLFETHKSYVSLSLSISVSIWFIQIKYWYDDCLPVSLSTSSCTVSLSLPPSCLPAFLFSLFLMFLINYFVCFGVCVCVWLSLTENFELN